MAQFFLSLFLFGGLLLSVKSIVYQSVQVGGNGGGEFDDITIQSLDNNENVFRLENILLWGGDDDERILAFQAKYSILDVARSGAQDGRLAGSASGSARHQIILSKKDVVTKAYGWMGTQLDLHSGVPLTTYLGFDVQRTDGGMDFYHAGFKRGANFTILGPIVGFYGGYGGSIDYIGMYVDPSWWPDRPSRLVMLRTAGRSFGDDSEVSFDHYLELGELFIVKIAEFAFYVSDSGAVSGLTVTYRDHVGLSTVIQTGNLTGTATRVVLAPADYISSMDVDNSYGASGDASTYCISGVRLNVYRGDTGATDTVSIGTIIEFLNTEGPIVAFYGVLFTGTNCVARLGGFKLIGSMELSKTCAIPDTPDDLMLLDEPQSIRTGSVLTYACANSSRHIVADGYLFCNGDGAWSGKFPICSSRCGSLDDFQNGVVIWSRDQYMATFICNHGFVLQGEEMLTCNKNGNWDYSIPECIYQCEQPLMPINGQLMPLASFYQPGQELGYTCNPGYSKLEDFADLTCSMQGSWVGDQPICTQDCALPAVPDNGQFSEPSQTFTPINSYLEYGCVDGYYKATPDLLCTTGAIWAPEAPICSQSVCGVPPTVVNGVYLNTATGYPTGYLLQYDCNPGLKIVGDLYVECTVQGFWRGAPVCGEETTTSTSQCPSLGASTGQSTQQLWTNCQVINLPGVIIVIVLLLLNIVGLLVAIAICFKWRLSGRDKHYDHDVAIAYKDGNVQMDSDKSGKAVLMSNPLYDTAQSQEIDGSGYQSAPSLY